MSVSKYIKMMAITNWSAVNKNEHEPKAHGLFRQVKVNANQLAINIKQIHDELD